MILDAPAKCAGSKCSPARDSNSSDLEIDVALHDLLHRRARKHEFFFNALENTVRLARDVQRLVHPGPGKEDEVAEGNGGRVERQRVGFSPISIVAITLPSLQFKDSDRE